MKIPKQIIKRRFILVLPSIVTILCTIQIINYLRKPVKYIIYYEPYDLHDISCHNTVVENDLPSADTWKFFPVKYSIYFIETSCKGGLDSRQACSIEAAALHNPKRQVYVLFVGPLSPHFKQSDTFFLLKSLGNVELRRIRLNRFVQRTPVEKTIVKALNQSLWTVHHTSDFLRFLTLYKYGGVYLDLDILTVRSFSSLNMNFISKESRWFIGSAALGMTKGLGQRFTSECMKELKYNFKPQEWLFNGPYLISRVMAKLCSTTKVSEMSKDTCRGIQVEKRTSFYPIHWKKWYKLFEPMEKANISTKQDKIYAYHYWNKRTRKYKVKRDSLFYHLAEKNCPKVHRLYGEDFGM